MSLTRLTDVPDPDTPIVIRLHKDDAEYITVSGDDPFEQHMLTPAMITKIEVIWMVDGSARTLVIDHPHTARIEA